MADKFSRFNEERDFQVRRPLGLICGGFSQSKISIALCLLLVVTCIDSASLSSVRELRASAAS